MVRRVRSIPEFLLVALVVTLTPGPATALVLRVAARDGRRAALGAVAGNSIGVLVWGCLSAVGVSSLILASEVAYAVLRVGGAAVLIVLGVRSILHRADDPADIPRGRPGWRSGLATAVANPKLAVFFIALFPQFLSPHAPVLPAATAMAAVIVAYDMLWFSALAYAVDRAGTLLRPRLRRTMERLTGGVMVGLGLSIAADVR
jgi:threonine/homoserine/homoserine lactone efflux protein